MAIDLTRDLPINQVACAYRDFRAGILTQHGAALILTSNLRLPQQSALTILAAEPGSADIARALCMRDGSEHHDRTDDFPCTSCTADAAILTAVAGPPLPIDDQADDGRRPNLDAIRRRTEAATPGPWKTGDRFNNGSLGSAVAVLSGCLPPVRLDPHRNGRADAAFIAHARQDIPAMLAEIIRLQGVLSGRIEGQRGCGLCDCSSADGEPTSPATGERMDHHCDCRAVTTAAMILGAYSATVHANQCGHGTEMDEFYK